MFNGFQKLQQVLGSGHNYGNEMCLNSREIWHSSIGNSPWMQAFVCVQSLRDVGMQACGSIRGVLFIKFQWDRGKILVDDWDII